MIWTLIANGLLAGWSAVAGWWGRALAFVDAHVPGGVVAVAAALAVFAAGVAFEHRPIGLLSFHVGPLGWTDPGGPAAQLRVLVLRERAAGARVVVVEKAQAAVAKAIAAHDVQVVTRIRTITRTITQEIPVALPPQTDRRYPLPVGFVRLHDAFARGVDLSQVPDPAGRADDAASDVGAARAVAVIGANYGDCRVDRARLADLQAWARQVAAAQNH